MSITDIFNGIGDFFTAVEDLFAALIDPHTYVRLFFIVIGGALVISALMYGK